MKLAMAAFAFVTVVLSVFGAAMVVGWYGFGDGNWTLGGIAAGWAFSWIVIGVYLLFRMVFIDHEHN